MSHGDDIAVAYIVQFSFSTANTFLGIANFLVFLYLIIHTLATFFLILKFCSFFISDMTTDELIEELKKEVKRAKEATKRVSNGKDIFCQKSVIVKKYLSPYIIYQGKGLGWGYSCSILCSLLPSLKVQKLQVRSFFKKNDTARIKNSRSECLFTEAGFRRCSVKKLFLKISQNSQENTRPRVSNFNKVSGVRLTALLKKRPWHMCFPVNF